MIEKEFCTYEEALVLKELGFNEPCFGYWKSKNWLIQEKTRTDGYTHADQECSAPLYQQAFRWFRENCDLHAVIMPKTTPSNTTVYYVYKGKFEEDWNNCFETYEEAELACLRRLIKLTNEEPTDSTGIS